MINIILTSFIGGIFVSDAVALFQIMLSRPIFCAPIIGMITGDIAVGLQVGMLMELIWISVVPMGVSVPPDASVVAISATHIIATSSYSSDRAFITFVILCMIPLGIVYKKIDIMQRAFNVKLARKVEQDINEGKINTIDKITYLSIVLFIIKASLFILLTILIFSKPLVFVYGLLNKYIAESMGQLFYIIPGIGFGTAMTSFIFKKSQKKKA